MNNKRLQILQAVQAQLETLTQLSDPQEISPQQARVAYWQDFDLEYAQDQLEFRDLEESIEQTNFPLDIVLPIQVRSLRYGENSLELGNEAILLIESAIVNQTWGGLSLKTNLTRTSLECDTTGQRSVLAEIVFTVRYRMEKTDYE